MELGIILSFFFFFLNSPLNICVESWFQTSLHRAFASLRNISHEDKSIPLSNSNDSRYVAVRIRGKQGYKSRIPWKRKKGPFRVAVARYLARVGNSCSIARTEHVVYSRAKKMTRFSVRSWCTEKNGRKGEAWTICGPRIRAPAWRP